MSIRTCFSILLLLLATKAESQSVGATIRSAIEKNKRPTEAQTIKLAEGWSSLSTAQVQDSLSDLALNEAGLAFRIGVWSYYQHRNQVSKAEQLQALESTLRTKGYKQLYPVLYKTLAHAAFFEREAGLEKVGRYYKQMLQYIEDLAPPKRINYYLTYIRYSFYNTKDYQEALRYLEKLKRIAEEEQLPQALSSSYELLARIYALWDNHEQADFYANKLLEMNDQSEATRAMALLYKAGWALEQEKWGQTKQYLQMVRQLMAIDSPRRTQASILDRLVYGKYFLQKMDYHWEQKEYEEIAAFLESEAYQGFGKRATFSDYIKMVGFTLRFDVFKGEEQQLRKTLKSLELLGSRVGKTLLNLAPLKVEAYFKLGEPTRALKFVDKSLSVLKQAAGEADQWLLPKVAMQLLHQKARFFAKGGPEQREQAAQCYQQAIKLMKVVQEQHAQESYKKQFFEQSDGLLHEAMAFFWERWEQTGAMAWVEAGFQVAEQNKANLLQDALQANRALQVGLLPDSLFKQEQTIQKQIAFLKTTLLEAEQRGDKALAQEQEQALFEQKETLLALKKRLVEDYPRYYDWRYNKKSIQLADFQAQLPDSVLVLELYSTPHHLHLLYIGKKEVQWRRIPYGREDRQKLDSYLQQLRTWSRSRPPTEIKALQDYAWKAYQALLGPILGKKSYAELWVIADEKWSHLPFETLITQMPEASSFSAATYLIRDYAIAYQYSAQLWMELKAMKQGASKNLLACLANAAHECSDNSRQCLQRKNLAPLDGAVAEVDFLVERYAGGFLEGQSATEAQFRKVCSDYRILHLAMHGKVDTTYPARSALWLHQSETESSEDDVLYAYELPSLQLSAELVVLSACETGAGKYLNGEGVLSLGRGFMYAGAKSLLMSRWSVNDQATAELMHYFYKGLEAKLDKAQALRQAKLQYLEAHPKQGSEPFFWAAFTLTGDTSPVVLETKGQTWSYAWLLLLPIALFIAWLWRKNSGTIGAA